MNHTSQYTHDSPVYPDVLIQLLMVPYFTLKSAIWMTNYIATMIINGMLVVCLRLLYYKYCHPDKVHISNFLKFISYNEISTRGHKAPLISSIGEM